MNVLRAAFCVLRRTSPVIGLVLLAVSSPRRLAAQSAEADAYWAAGNYHQARIAYEQVLVGDLANVRANYRLGILLSWDNKLDSSLVMIRRARAEDHQDPDLEVMEAKVLSWAGRTDQAVAHYDSVIARAPDKRDAWLGKALALGWAGRYDDADATYAGWLQRSPDDEDALVGRARVRAWQGDLGGARSMYRETLAHQPGSGAALAGLAQVDRWEGHERLALARADSALRVTPDDRDARQLQRELRAALRPQLQFTFGWGRDSDHNESFWENLTATQSVADGVILSGTTGFFEASDPIRTGNRTLGEIGIAVTRGRFGFGAGAGARLLFPEIGNSRSSPTARASLSFRASSKVGLGAGIARVPFDETAALIARDLDVTSAEGNVSIKARRDLELGVGLGGGWLNDGNSRTSVVGAATWSFAKYFFAGPYYRRLSYDHPGVGYFAPAPYTLAELRGGVDRRWGKNEVRLSGGYGTQEINSGGSQSAWHADARIVRTMRVIDELALFGGITNAASASTTGAFKYSTAGVSLRLGL